MTSFLGLAPPALTNALSSLYCLLNLAAKRVCTATVRRSKFYQQISPQIHLMEPAKSHAVGICNGDGARRVTCCLSMSTCVTYT